MVQYYVERKDNPKTKDEAMRQVADFVYNVFKYHLVKYLGLFDVFFRYQVSKSENINMEEVAGLGLLLQKLEYNALSPNARKVSDYGVPFKLIDCYDSKSPYDKGQFDAYEQHGRHPGLVQGNHCRIYGESENFIIKREITLESGSKI